MIRIFLIFLLLSAVARCERSIHVYACLCDNEHQGIVKVGAKIGNGMDPDGNLYWGCSDGLNTYFKNSKLWTSVSKESFDGQHFLRKVVFKHKRTGVLLVAHAYRGDRMKECLEDFLVKSRDSGKGDLVVFIGHNGLMDTKINVPAAAAKDDDQSESIVFACITERYFQKPLAAMNSRPLVLTKSLMYPGAFLLHDVAEVWLNKGDREAMRNAAASAYAKNQKISVKGAKSVFAEINP